MYSLFNDHDKARKFSSRVLLVLSRILVVLVPLYVHGRNTDDNIWGKLVIKSNNTLVEYYCHGSQDCDVYMCGIKDESFYMLLNTGLCSTSPSCKLTDNGMTYLMVSISIAIADILLLVIDYISMYGYALNRTLLVAKLLAETVLSLAYVLTIAYFGYVYRPSLECNAKYTVSYITAIPVIMISATRTAPFFKKLFRNNYTKPEDSSTPTLRIAIVSDLLSLLTRLSIVAIAVYMSFTAESLISTVKGADFTLQAVLNQEHVISSCNSSISCNSKLCELSQDTDRIDVAISNGYPTCNQLCSTVAKFTDIYNYLYIPVALIDIVLFKLVGNHIEPRIIYTMYFLMLLIWICCVVPLSYSKTECDSMFLVSSLCMGVSYVLSLASSVLLFKY